MCNGSCTYLGQILFVLTLLKSVAVVICCLVGKFSNDGVLHLICETKPRTINIVLTTSKKMHKHKHRRTSSGLENEDLLCLAEHDLTERAHRLGGDVHGGLSVQCRQHCILYMRKCTACQLERDPQCSKHFSPSLKCLCCWRI